VDFDWFVPAGRSGRLWRHARETLWHVSWANREIRRALRLAGFDRVAYFDGVDVRPPLPYQRRGMDAY
jgi:hypothetical protein